MARAELYVGELLLKLVSRETGEISKVDYHPQKPEFLGVKASLETFLERTSPESQGVSSAFFYDLIKELQEDKECKMHKFMALRHGKVIAECAFEPYDIDMWHVSYSMCKSITGMAIGILINEGKLSLDTKLSEIFGARMGFMGLFKKPITVMNLLNMSSGIDFNEAGAISGNDWRKSFLEAGFKFEPGTRFEYNSMNTYMLSAIVTEITGMSLFDFCKDRIFTPMGIRRVFWESCPQSITKGGWGLFMRAEDMAKLGVLYLQNGKWEGEQIIPRMWVSQSTSWQIATEKDDNEHYGFQIWINDDRPGSYAFNGMLGQNVFIYPDIDMVVVTNAGNSDIFQTSPMAVRIRDAMKDRIKCSDEPLPEDFYSLSKLKALCKYVGGRTASFPVIRSGGWKNKKRSSLKCGSDLRTLDCINGRIYDLETTGVGIFPVMVQVVHNNFTDGMKKIGFRKEENNAFFIDIHEGEMIFPLRCGFDGKHYVSNINMHGENYKVSLSSLCTRDEYNRFVIRNEISFLEEACVRIFDIHFGEDLRDGVPGRIEIRMHENPGSDMLIDTMKNITPDIGGFDSFLVSKFLKGGKKDVLEEVVKNTLQPTIHGNLVM
ncbi:MAG: beta-lactamase family protein [Butyrivibrio sp.]|nr:beta-lactamase family protein [Butyrivibrio sp.]